MRRLIGITGLKGAGKDTAARPLVEEGWTVVKMAGGLKAMLSALMKYQGAAPAEIAEALEGGAKEVPSDCFGWRTPRHAMVTLGTEWGREHIAPDFWVRVAERQILANQPAVVTDIRFPNEVELIKRLGGLMIRVDRPGLVAGDHPSESQIQGLEVDFVFSNRSTEAALQHALRSIVLGAR